MNAIKSSIRSILSPIAKRLGYVHWRDAPEPDSHLSLEAAMRRLIKRNMAISTVIDVGAAVGEWAEKILPVLPDAQYLLIEANPYHEDRLKQFIEQHSNMQIALVAASNQDGTIHFDTRDPFGGVASIESHDRYDQLPARSIDSLIAEHDLQPPYMLKLDTHGFEVPIIEGAIQTLQQTNVLLVETYNFQIQDDSLMFYEFCQYMRERGFRVADMVEPLHRHADQLLWQVDILFIRDDRPEFENNAF